MQLNAGEWIGTSSKRRGFRMRKQLNEKQILSLVERWHETKDLVDIWDFIGITEEDYRDWVARKIDEVWTRKQR